MLQNKTFTKILSVVIALVLWVYVIGEINPTTTKKLENISVRLLNTENLASKGLVALDGESFFVNLTVEGKRADILSIKKENLLVTADLFGFGLGENYINLSVELPYGIRLISTEPSKLKVTIDELITANKPVVINYIGQLPEAIEPGQISVVPETLEINGARSIVDKVAYIGAELDVKSLEKEAKIFNPYVSAYDEAGELVTKIKISSETIEVGARLMNTKVVPLILDIVGQEQPELQITNIKVPDKIEIRGDMEMLETIEEILAEEIDVSHFTSSTEVPIKAFLPDGIEVAKSSQSLAAKIDIKGLSSKSFEFNTSVIKTVGLGDGFTVEIVPGNLVVSIADRDTALDKIKSTDVDITINLEGLGLGTHQVEVKAEIDGSSENINIGPNLVTVNIHGAQ